MKKLTALLLGLVLILALAACNKEPKETTPAPTDPAVTTPAPKTDKNAKPEDVFTAMRDHLKALSDSLSGESKEAVQGNLKASGSLVLSMGNAESEIQLILGGKAEGGFDSQKGAHLETETRSNLDSLVMAMMGGEAEEPVVEAQEIYLDLDSKRTYSRTIGADQWYYTENGDSNTGDGEGLKWEDLTLNKLFESYTFTVLDDVYVFEGKLNMSQLDDSLGDVESVSAYTQGMDKLSIKLTLTVDDEKRLVGLVLAGDPLAMALPIANGISMDVNIKELKADLEIRYEAFAYSLPAEIPAGAQESGNFLIGDQHSWTNDSYDLSNAVLVDNEYVTIRLTAIEDREYLGPQLTMEVKNNSQNPLSIDLEGLMVNGYSMTVYGYESVEASSIVTMTCNVDADELQYPGIKHLDELTIHVAVNDKSAWEEVCRESVTLYPRGLTPDQISYPAVKTTPNQLVVVDNEQFKYVLLSFEDQQYIGGTILRAYYENKSDMTLRLSYLDPTLNDKSFADASSWLFQEELLPGFKGYTEEYISADLLSKAGIDSITKMSFVLELKDAENSWDQDSAPVYTQEVVWEP